MKKRVISAILATTLITGILGGCSGGTAAQTTQDTSADTKSQEESQAMNLPKDLEGTKITFWHSMGGVNGEAITYLVDKFNKENDKGITVEAQYQGEYDDTINKLKSAQIGNMGADLVQVYEIGTRFMLESGWAVPMQELIDADGYDSSKLEENIAAYYTIDNQLYSMPFNTSTPILYYNKDMFTKAGISEAPGSFPEIEEISEALVSQGGAGEPISLGIYGWFFEQFICKQGLAYADNGNGREKAASAVDFDKNGAALNILNAWKSLYDKGYAPNVGRGGDAGLTDFSAGKSAITLGSTASLKQILQDVNGKFEVGTAYFPGVTAEEKGGVSIGGASLWALDNKDDKKKAATWELIKFLVSAESQAYWNTQTGYFPVTTDAYNEDLFKENIALYPQFQTAIDQLHASAPQYQGALLSVFPEARQVVETQIEDMLNGKQTAEDGVKNMAEQINKSIEEYNILNE